MPKLDASPKKLSKKPQPKAGTNGAPVKPDRQSKPKPVTAENRDVVYSEVGVKVYRGKDALTAAQAKEYIGWEEENVNDKNYMLTDETGKKVRCFNNSRNIRLDYSLCLMLASEILHRRWEFNGEALIIGRTGETLSAQHRLIALIIAGQLWHKDPEKWAEYWTTEPTMECLIVFGIEESDKVVNTIGSGRQRKFEDVLYRSKFLESLPPAERKVMSKSGASAVKLLMHRTGAFLNALSPGRCSHTDSVDFLMRHDRLMDCLRHCYEEEGGADKQISEYLPIGYSSALLFMMACSKSDPVKYREAEHPSEDLLDWSLLEEAKDFFLRVAQHDKSLAAFFNVYGTLLKTRTHVTRQERIALIVKAWNKICLGGSLVASDLELVYSEPDDNGITHLAECPDIGGIDLGEPKDDTESDEEDTEDPTPEEIEERKAAERTAKEAKKAQYKTGKKSNGTPAIGDIVWVAEDGGHWSGKLIEMYDVPNGKVCRVQTKNGKVFDAPLTNVSLTDPEK